MCNRKKSSSNLLYPEKLVYSVGFKFINVGTATISSKKNKDGELDVGQFPDNLIVKHWDKHF